MSSSLDKIRQFKHAMLSDDAEVFEGLLGAVQGVIGMAEMTGTDVLDELPQDPAELDEKLLEVAAFILWLRSDDAPIPDAQELTETGPALIGELAAGFGIG